MGLGLANQNGGGVYWGWPIKTEVWSIGVGQSTWTRGLLGLANQNGGVVYWVWPIQKGGVVYWGWFVRQRFSPSNTKPLSITCGLPFSAAVLGPQRRSNPSHPPPSPPHLDTRIKVCILVNVVVPELEYCRSGMGRERETS